MAEEEGQVSTETPTITMFSEGGDERQAQLDAERALQAAQIAGQAYGQTTGAPEEGSLAEAVTGG